MGLMAQIRRRVGKRGVSWQIGVVDWLFRPKRQACSAVFQEKGGTCSHVMPALVKERRKTISSTVLSAYTGKS